MFCEVERSYIEDGFNLYGLRTAVPNFSDCLDLILDRHGQDDSDDSHLAQSACTLYGLIHARYIITAHGLDAMYSKYAGKEFGTCPLVQCHGQPVLPVGLRDEIGCDSVKIFCPKCQCVYQPPNIHPYNTSSGIMNSMSFPTSTITNASNLGRGGTSSNVNVYHSTTSRNSATHTSTGGVDGASFGTTFPHLFLMTFNNLVPDRLEVNSRYVPRVFGFKLHSNTRGGSSLNGARSSNASRSNINHNQQQQWRNNENNNAQEGAVENGNDDVLKRPASVTASGGANVGANGANFNDTMDNASMMIAKAARQQDEASSISTGVMKRKRRGK